MYDNRDPSFLGALFDMSFSTFVTESLASIVYMLVIFFSAFFAVVYVVREFLSSLGEGLFAIFLAPIGWILFILIARITLELIVVVFKIADNTKETAINTKFEK